MKTYEYTLFRQDGTQEVVHTGKELPFKSETNQKTGDVTKGLYHYLNCTTIELIHSDYYPDDSQEGDLYFGDEEARFDEDNKRNPFMKVLFDPFNNEFDVVGDLIRQRVVGE